MDLARRDFVLGLTAGLACGILTSKEADAAVTYEWKGIAYAGTFMDERAGARLPARLVFVGPNKTPYTLDSRFHDFEAFFGYERQSSSGSRYTNCSVQHLNNDPDWGPLFVAGSTTRANTNGRILTGSSVAGIVKQVSIGSLPGWSLVFLSPSTIRMTETHGISPQRTYTSIWTRMNKQQKVIQVT